MAKPTPQTVDVFLSTLDQQSPTTAKPLGRLKRLINAVVRKYQNPRAADGTVTHVSVEKRNGFQPLATTVHNVDGVSLGSLDSDTPQVLFGGGDALRMVAANRLYTKTQGWVKASTTAGGDTVVLPQILRSKPIYAADSQAEAPDMAVIGDVQCHVWREVSRQSNDDATSPTTTATALDGVRIMLRDSTGVVRAPFTRDPIGGGTDYRKARVLAAGGYFWVLQDSASTGTTFRIDVTLIDTTGAIVASTNFTTPSGGELWDSAVQTVANIIVAMPNNGSGVQFKSLGYSSGFSIATTTDTTIKCGGKQCAWETTEAGTSNPGYLVTVHGATATSEVWAYKIVNGVQTHEFPQVAGPIDQTATIISGITGYTKTSSATPDLVVAFSLMQVTTSILVGSAERTIYVTDPNNQLNSSASDVFPDQLTNEVRVYSVTYAGASTVLSSRFSMSLASRAFRLGADYVAIGYYPARKYGPLTKSGAAAPHLPYRPADPSNFQPTWYVIPLAAAQIVNQGAAIAGRFEYGLATADYQVCAYSIAAAAIIPGPRNRFLGSPATLANGAIALPLGYRAEQNIPSATLFVGQEQPRTDGIGFGAFVGISYQSDNTVGVKLFTFGPDCGQPFVANETTYIPGLLAAVVEPGDVELVEQGLIAPECPIVVRSGTASAPPVDGAYFWRVVGEYTSRGGKTCRSLPSAAFSYKALIADGKAMEVAFHSLAQTLKKNVKLSIYRTGFVTATVDGTATITTPPTQTTTPPLTNVATSGAYKITNDLRPFYNSPTTPGLSRFTDLMGASTQGTGELLYTDQGMLPRFPAPAFRGGCVWQNRAWLIGYDNALWFSGEITEGESEWFNPGLRVAIPSSEEITAIAAMDSFLLVFCTGSIWYLPAGAALPDNAGVGTIPTAVRLPFEMGCTGFTAVIRQGCVYSSSAGGAWLITRSLDNEWIGQGAQDDLDFPIKGIVNAGNYVVVTTETSLQQLVVFDTNLGGWGRWDLLSDSAIVSAFGGQTVWADPGRVFAMTPGMWLDDGFYVPMSVTVAPVHIAGVRNWKRTWALQLEGETFDACTIGPELSYSDADVIDYVAPVYAAAGAGLLELEVRPNKQLTASMGVTVSDSQGGTLDTGRGFSLEVLGFYIGVEKGNAKLAPPKRV